jgi:hypothetical protein
MRKKLTIIYLLTLLVSSCANNQETPAVANKMVRIEITDRYLRNILTEYSNHFNFEGKGVILTNIRQKDDTVKYVVNIFIEKDFIDYYLSRKQFVFYDTIGKRIVILDTKLESFFKPRNVQTESDTILNKFLDKNKQFYEIYQLEYTRIDSLITRKIIREQIF